MPYCWDVLGADPTPEILIRARKFNERVLPASLCRQESHGYVNSDGKRALMLRVVEVRRVSLSVVRLEVTMDSGAMFGSSGGTYIVERLSGYWVVTGYELGWVS